MRVYRRPLAPGELDHELIWLSVSLAALAFAAIWVVAGLPWPHCIFLTLTGHPCASCGATRSVTAFFHADFLMAWKWNPMIFIGLCALSIFDLYAFGALVTRGRRFRLERFTTREKNLVRLLLVVFLALNWLYLLSRPPNVL